MAFTLFLFLFSPPPLSLTLFLCVSLSLSLELKSSHLARLDREFHLSLTSTVLTLFLVVDYPIVPCMLFSILWFFLHLPLVLLLVPIYDSQQQQKVETTFYRKFFISFFWFSSNLYADFF